MLFTTIEPAPGLSPPERRRVAHDGPSAVVVRTSYPGLLRSAGFTASEHRDVTEAYRTTQQAWLDAMRRRAPAIGAAMGADALQQRLADRTRALACVDDGLLRRSRYVAERSGGGDLSP